MAALSTQTINRQGLAPTYSAAAGGGDTLTAGDYTFLHVKNGGGGSITVTVTPPSNQNPISDVTYAAKAYTVNAATDKMIGPFPQSYFGDAITTNVAITYSGVTSVTVAALALVHP